MLKCSDMFKYYTVCMIISTFNKFSIIPRFDINLEMKDMV